MCSEHFKDIGKIIYIKLSFLQIIAYRKLKNYNILPHYLTVDFFSTSKYKVGNISNNYLSILIYNNYTRNNHWWSINVTWAFLMPMSRCRGYGNGKILISFASRLSHASGRLPSTPSYVRPTRSHLIDLMNVLRLYLILKINVFHRYYFYFKNCRIFIGYFIIKSPFLIAISCPTKSIINFYWF